MSNVTHGNHLLAELSFKTGLYDYYDFESDTFYDPDPTDTVSSYSVSGLPTGIGFLSASRYFYGTPSGTTGNYSVSVTANGSDGSKDTLTFILHLGSSSYPKYGSNRTASLTVPENTQVGNTIGTTIPTSGAAPNQYAVVWSNSNAAGSAYGTNNSPFSVNSSGAISVSKTLDYQAMPKHTVWIEAKDTATGLQDVSKITVNIDFVMPAHKPVIMLGSGW